MANASTVVILITARPAWVVYVRSVAETGKNAAGKGICAVIQDPANVVIMGNV